MKERKDREVLEYDVIVKATGGDTEAIQAVLVFFNKYINRLSTKMLYDESGCKYSMIDYELKSQIESKLVSKILLFKIK
ncbi:TPA: helix-turn-helix domain-containing protein [Listeria monocytogenes]